MGTRWRSGPRSTWFSSAANRSVSTRARRRFTRNTPRARNEGEKAGAQHADGSGFGDGSRVERQQVDHVGGGAEGGGARERIHRDDSRHAAGEVRAEEDSAIEGP